MHIVSTSPRVHTYDTDALEDFLRLIFHSPLHEGENILVWCREGNSFWYPITEAELIKKLNATHHPQSLYVGTSTCSRDKEGNLRNQGALFSRLWMVVLDDIGTKIPLDKLPAELLPTYSIQSSQGNFQFGYVFEEPIDNFEQAKAFIQLVYDSGLTDSGGKMPTKLVRLPDGINGKKGKPKEFFKVQLEFADGPLWTPAKFLEVIDQGVTWAEIKADAAKVSRDRASRGAGSSLWSPTPHVSASSAGIVDPVLEWLYEEGMVIQDRGDWVDIECIRCQEHTTGDNSAGYSPLDRGESKNQRGYNCFHSHEKMVKDKDGIVKKVVDKPGIKDLLQYAAANGGPEASTREHAIDLVSRYVYDYTNGWAWDIKVKGRPIPVAMGEFGTKHPHSVKIIDEKGKSKSVSEKTLFIKSKSRVTVQNCRFDPTSRSKIVKDKIEKGELFVNLCTHPDFGTGPYDLYHINKFMDYVNYLIPEGKEVDFFLDWLAAKIQDMAFRGPAILMIAPREGTGRNTLADMCAALLRPENRISESFRSITSNSDFNEYMEKPLVVISETKDPGGGEKPVNYYAAHEKLKEMIDPRPLHNVTINPKFGKKRIVSIYSSWLLFSNHSDALKMSGDARRFYVIANVLTPAPSSYFMALNAWLEKEGADGHPVWVNHVGRWLMERKPDLERLFRPAENTAKKDEMKRLSMRALDVAMDAILKTWPGPFININSIKDALFTEYEVKKRLNIDHHKNPEASVNACIREHTTPMNPRITVKVRAATTRPKIISSRLTPEIEKIFIQRTESLRPSDNTTLTDSLEYEPDAKFYEKIGEALDLADF